MQSEVREWDKGKPFAPQAKEQAKDQQPDFHGIMQIEYTFGREIKSADFPRRRRQRESNNVNLWERSPSPPRKRYIDEFQDYRTPWQKRMDVKHYDARVVPEPIKSPPRAAAAAVAVAPTKPTTAPSAEPISSGAAVAATMQDDADDGFVVGPKPLPKAELGDGKTKYSEKMFKGEGEAMALFVQQKKRIPRRGEIGLTSQQIENFETSGYVMSGSRNRRMTLARLRKEAAVYSVEEKRALEALEQEERHLKEHRILAEMRALAAEAQRKARDLIQPSDGGTHDGAADTRR